MQKTRRRAILSPSLAPAIKKAPEVSAYAATTHWMAEGLACRPACIEGKATLTMKKSSTTMNVPPRRTASEAQRLARTAAQRVTDG
jgi:hypothetical protein